MQFSWQNLVEKVTANSLRRMAEGSKQESASNKLIADRGDTENLEMWSSEQP